MKVEQKIWNDFREQPKLYSYAEAKDAFGIDYEDSLNTTHGHRWIKNDNNTKIDRAIDKAIESGDWSEVLKAYPQTTHKYVESKQKYPKPKYRTVVERAEINKILLNDWAFTKEKIHSMFQNEQQATDYLIDKRWGDSIVCPRCGGDRIYLMKSRQEFKCGNSNCYYKFTPTAGTVFQNTKMPLIKWYEAMYLLVSTKTNKISTPQLAFALGTPQLTAWRVVHRLKTAIDDPILSKIKRGLFD